MGGIAGDILDGIISLARIHDNFVVETILPAGEIVPNRRGKRTPAAIRKIIINRSSGSFTRAVQNIFYIS